VQFEPSQAQKVKQYKDKFSQGQLNRSLNNPVQIVTNVKLLILANFGVISVTACDRAEISEQMNY